MTGRFITFEGGEGAGKSTQLRLLAQGLTAAGIPTLTTREPGGAPNAEFLRTMLLSGEHDFAPLTETLLHVAARAEHVARTIRPALAAGQWVLCDRFFDSTDAYQGFGQGADRATIGVLAGLIHPHPDLTLILDVTEKTASVRQAARGRAADRYDRLGPAFHARVAAGFRQIAAENPTRCVLIDANPDAASVAAQILQCVQKATGGLGGMAHLPQPSF
jgi:dTMP kinase